MQKFKRQVKSFKRFEKENDIEFLINFEDDCTGSNFDRPNWIKLEKLLNDGDTLVIKDISRFTREAENGHIKYMELLNKGINIIFIDNPTISTKYIKNMMKLAESQPLVARTALEGTIKLLLIVELDRVQQEREILIQRTKDGLRASGKKLGRKPGVLIKMSEELKEDLEMLDNDRSIKYISIMKKHNISRNTLKKYLKLFKERKQKQKDEEYKKLHGEAVSLFSNQ